MSEHGYHPILYVRGYAGSQGAIEDTTATPYMGFNVGSTKYRHAESGAMQAWVFESPLIRLMKDHGYVDAYRDGQLAPRGAIDPRSVWIFRYYDHASKDFGTGHRLEIEDWARLLREEILRIRERTCATAAERRDFRVHLVAHSMGGLICRAYLQNPYIPDLAGATPGRGDRKGVAKLFTYATPHGGIEFRQGLGWAEGLRDFLDANNQGNFGEERMRRFLKLPKKADLRSLEGRFPVRDVFCVVGTDSRDYGAAAGLSRLSVGPASDGLVQIRNAYVRGASRSFVHRSHSGHYGIVNSESAYQCLERFLFGDTRVQFDLHVDRLDVPDYGGRATKATYQIEVTAAIRGLPEEISRRLVNEHSAAFLPHDELVGRDETLFTTFLDRGKIVKANGRTMGFSLRVRILAEYHVDRRWRRDDHFEGNALFDDTLVVLAQIRGDGTHTVRHSWLSRSANPRAALELAKERGRDEWTGTVPFRRTSAPRAEGRILVRVSPWNA